MLPGARGSSSTCLYRKKNDRSCYTYAESTTDRAKLSSMDPVETGRTTAERAEGPGVAQPRRPRADGERSRQRILETAARLATVEGIDGLSIGRLAQATGMSKSGLFAHFASKAQLQ